MSDFPEADCEPGLTHPRAVYDLFGLKSAEQELARAFDQGRMHHAWMIAGPKGIGKATLAYRLARRALGADKTGPGLQTEPNDRVCRQIEAQSNPDFLVLRRSYNDKTKKLRGEISVDDARKVSGFFSHSASGDHWRVCLVDSADDMNVNSANALLKTLEEPPQKGLLILIVHAPGRLLPTIRSRCRTLTLRTPDVTSTADWLRSSHRIEQEQAHQAAELANGSPGFALSLLENDLIELQPLLDGILKDLPRIDSEITTNLAARAGKKDAEVFLDTLMGFLVNKAETRARNAAIQPDGLDKADRWVSAAKDIRQLAREQKAIYLDPKQTVLAAFQSMQNAANQK